MLALWAVSASFDPIGQADTPKPVVLAHYMPWFRAERDPAGRMIWEHWQWLGPGTKHNPDDVLPNGRRDICSIYYPLAGAYDGRDPYVLEYHMLTAKAAGIEGFVADWYGPADFSDKVFAAMTKAAERYGMRVAICLEEKTFFPPYTKAATRGEAMDAMASQLEYVLSRYGGSPAYLRRRGQPVFFVFQGWETTALGPNTLTPAETSEVLQRFADRKILYVRNGVDTRFRESTKGCYIWTADGQPRQRRYEAASAARKDGALEFWVGGACPGFNDTGIWGWGRGPRVTDRRGTKEFDEHWRDVLAHRPDAVQLITWNDFAEGTTIEPAEEYRFEFLNLTEQYVEKFNGRRARADDNEWAYRLLKLRRRIAALPDGASRRDWTRRLDGFARDLAAGRRWWMERRLKVWESAAPGTHLTYQ